MNSNLVRWYKNKYFYTTTSIIALVIYGFVVHAAPAVTYNPGETLDPTDPNCHTDNSCVVVIPGATIGGNVIGGTPNQILYTDVNGNVTSDSLFTRTNDQASFNVTSNLANNETGSFTAGNNMLGVGLSGVGTFFQTSSPGVNAFMAVDTTPFGGQPDSTFTGYLNPFGNGNANMQTIHEVGGDSHIQFSLQDDNNTHRVQMLLEAKSSGSGITFAFDGSDAYEFPTTSPGAGQVLGYVSANTLGWVSNGGGGGGSSIGDGIAGSTPNEILYVNNSGNLANSSGFQFSDVSNTFEQTDLFGNRLLYSTSGTTQIGDIDNAGNGTQFIVNDATSQVKVYTGGDFSVKNIGGANTLFQVYTISKLVQAGDVDSSFQGLLLNIDNTNRQIFLGNGGAAGGNGTNINIDDGGKVIRSQLDGSFLIQPTGTPQSVFSVDVASSQIIGNGKNGVIFGDYYNTGSNTLLTVNDAASSIYLNAINLVQMGDINLANNGTRFLVDDTGRTITSTALHTKIINSANGRTMFNASDNASYSILQLGDVDNALNGTLLKIDDSGQRITMNGGGGATWGLFDSFNHKVVLGDSNLVANRTLFTVDDVGGTITASGNVLGPVGVGLKLDFANNIYELGQISGGTANHTMITVDDGNHAITFTYGGDSYTFPMSDGTAGQFLATNGSGQIAWTSPFVTVSVADNNIFTPSIGGGTSLAGGQGDILLGLNAGHLITTAGNTIAIGSHAGETGTTEGANVLIGNQAGQRLTGGNSVMIGHGAGAFTQFKFSNVFVGYLSGVGNLTGSNNMFLGSNSGVSNTSGSYNVAIGDNAGIGNQTGDSNLFLGSNSGASSNALNASIALGRGAVVTASNQMMIGSVTSPINDMVITGSGFTTCSVNTISGAGISCSSDERLKKNITDLDTNVLDTLTKLKTVTFNWKSGNDTADHIGFIAQDMQQYYPELVSTASNGYLQVNYAGITPVLVEAIREMNLKINDIDAHATAILANETFMGGMRSWFAAETNAITLIISDTIKARNQICIDDVCMNKDQLKQLLEQQNQGSGVVSQTPTGQTSVPTDPVTDPATDPVVDTVPAPVIDTVPVPDPVPVVDSAPVVAQ